MPKEDRLNWQERISVDPAVAAGHPVIKGTRVPVEVVVGTLGGGASIEEVCNDYGLEEDDIRAALVYAADLIARRREHALSRR